MTHNLSLTPDILPSVLLLDRFMILREIAAQIKVLADQALEDLKMREIYSVVPFAVKDFKVAPPELLGSIRIAAFHPNCEMDQERHSNSDQFLYSLAGHGETRVLRAQWESDMWGDGLALEDRWHVVPQNVWHQSIGRGDKPWVMAALHTARKVQDEFRPAI